ncbi:MAG TPA: hypothetical protein VIO94_15950 [Phenylobacterium sp.]
MAASTFTGTRAEADFPVFKAHGSGVMQVARGVFTLTEVPEVGDVWKLCKLPAGAVVIGGYFAATDIDTGTETLDIDLGWAANGAESADPDGFGNFGLISGDSPGVDVTNGVVAVQRNLGFTSPPTFTRETVVQAQCVAVAAAGGTGTIAAVIHYVVP